MALVCARHTSTPLVSTIITFSSVTPRLTQKLAQAMAEAPAPETTTRMSSMRFWAKSTALSSAAPADDGRAVLIVVEDGNVHLLLEPLLDDEALGRLDVFQVDAAEGGLERLHHGAERDRSPSR